MIRQVAATALKKFPAGGRDFHLNSPIGDAQAQVGSDLIYRVHVVAPQEVQLTTRIGHKLESRSTGVFMVIL